MQAVLNTDDCAEPVKVNPAAQAMHTLSKFRGRHSTAGAHFLLKVKKAVSKHRQDVDTITIRSSLTTVTRAERPL